MALLQGTSVQRINALWRGVGASLAKDVPFAAIYWSLMEPMREHLAHSVALGQHPVYRMIAGSIGLHQQQVSSTALRPCSGDHSQHLGADAHDGAVGQQHQRGRSFTCHAQHALQQACSPMGALAINGTAGVLAGAAAAAITTPFGKAHAVCDVPKHVVGTTEGPPL